MYGLYAYTSSRMLKKSVSVSVFILIQVSRACTSICQWVRAMHKYHFVSKAVAPKRVSAFGLNCVS